MASANKVARPILVGGLGLAAAGAFVAFCALVAAAVLGVFLASGTLQHTSQGWVFRAGSLEPSTTQVSREPYDPQTYTLLTQYGTGPQRTAAFTSAGAWSLTWAYDCPDASGSIQVVAFSEQGAAYPAGLLSRTSKGAGQSDVLPAGTYSLQLEIGAPCTWSVGARPNH